MGDKAKRPTELWGSTYKIKMPKCGTLFITVNLPLEVICRMGRAQNCQNVWVEAVSRLISLCLQSGADVEDVIEQLQNLRCEGGPLLLGKGKTILSCPDGIAKVLKEKITPEEVQNSKEKDEGIISSLTGENTVLSDSGEEQNVYRDNISDKVA